MTKYNNVPLQFDVTLYGTLEPFDESKSKCRVRIFYKGLNRNRTYISEDFANQLIASLPYSPVKGIFNSDEVDFEGHGEKNTDGKIYGLVMAEPNFAWEDHLDSDGITRTYACADVLLYTGLYNEAKLVPESSQSMEINPFTYEGEWRIWEEDGQPYYFFKKGSLFGLQVLGTDVEPCFEGAAFYNLVFEKLQNDFLPLMDYVKENMKKKEERITMDRILFRLSDNQKAQKIWDSINPNFNEEGGWKIDYFISEVYDDYALVIGDEGYKRAYYEKNDEADSVTISKMESCYVTDVTETEMKALEVMKSAAGSYEEFAQTATDNMALISEKTTEIETLTNSLNEANEALSAAQVTIEENNGKIEELTNNLSEKDNAIEEINTKYSTLESEKVELENSISDLKNENEELANFKVEVETNEKKAILGKYTQFLTETVIKELNEKLGTFSVEEFKKEVCTAAVEQNGETLFNKSGDQQIYFKGDVDDSKGVTGVERILDKYKNGGNK